MLDGDGFRDDILHRLLAWAMVEVGEEQAGEIGVHALVTRYQFVGEGEAGHESTLLEPEYGGEGAAEEDTLDGSEGDQTLSKGGVLICNPFKGPVGFLADARDCDESA